MKRYEYVLKVADGSLWLKAKECIKSRGEVENLDIRYLDNGNIKLSFDSDNYEIIDKATTAKAIPIEWIEKWISERNDFPTMPYNQHIWNMLDDWEAERKEE